MRLKKRKGFTLIEVLVVIVILGVLAGLAVPVYVGQIEKSRATEALDHLASTRSSAIRFFSEKNSYATIANDLTNLDYNPNTARGGQNQLFSYAASGQGPAAFVITATRIIGTVNGEAVPAGGPHTITIDQDGSVDRGTTVYK